MTTALKRPRIVILLLVVLIVTSGLHGCAKKGFASSSLSTCGELDL